MKTITETKMITPKQFAKANKYYVLTLDREGLIYADRVTGADGRLYAQPFAFKTERTAIRHASRRKTFYVRPDGIVTDPRPASDYWGFCSIHGNYTPSVGCRKCAERPQKRTAPDPVTATVWARLPKPTRRTIA